MAGFGQAWAVTASTLRQEKVGKYESRKFSIHERDLRSAKKAETSKERGEAWHIGRLVAEFREMV